MLNLGIIGTNWITSQFIEAALSSEKYQLTCVYSRNLAKGQTFADDQGVHGARIYDNLQNFFADDVMDVVYIASPNSLHYAQAKAAILAGKHVIVEKPAFANPAEYADIAELLEQTPKIYLFEAARHIHEHNFKTVQQYVSELTITGATLTYMKYSSRYDQVLNGEVPNIFSPEFAGGALQDLGVYVVYDAVCWFGMPESAVYQAVMTTTGVDGDGTAILTYPGYQVRLIFGKTVQSYLPSEIYAGKQTLWIDSAGTLGRIERRDMNEKNPVEVLSEAPLKNPMLAEARVFADTINTKDQTTYQHLLTLSQQVNQVLAALHQSAGLHFPTDQH